MFYRRKIILALLELFDGQLEKIRLQKLLFLFSQQQKKADYDFIPYKYGCYSYSANADLTIMTKRGILTETEGCFTSSEKTGLIGSLKETDRQLMLQIKNVHGKMNSAALIRYTYINYPFFAINSITASDILTKKEFEKINASKPAGNKTILFTIGYEGISLEEYLTRLLKNNIKVLVDVRNNPKSMKYGFSKNQIKKYCESLGIQYLHFPEVGIQSEQRKGLKSQNDYDKLFNLYKKENLAQTKPAQITIFNLLKQYRRIALTCFEANICQCHRKYLAEAIGMLPGFEYETKHI
jgi:uncharacterized protein (DUF488 family)